MFSIGVGLADALPKDQIISFIQKSNSCTDSGEDCKDALLGLPFYARCVSPSTLEIHNLFIYVYELTQALMLLFDVRL